MNNLGLWHLYPSSNASPSIFLDIVEKWVSNPARQRNYNFDFSKPLKSYLFEKPVILKGTNETSESTLQMISGVDSLGNTYVAVSIDKKTIGSNFDNFIWIVDIVYKKSPKESSNDYIMVFLKRKIDNPDIITDINSRRFVTPPAILRMLVEEGVAIKDNPIFVGKDYSNAYDRMVIPNENQRRLLEKQNNLSVENLPKYPLLYVNVPKLTTENKKRTELDCSPYAHIIYTESSETWVYRIVYPRLAYEAEIRESGISHPDPSDSNRIKHIYTRSLIKTTARELLSLTNEAFNNCVFLDVIGVKHRLAAIGPKQIPITAEIASAIRNQRRNLGYTQQDVADRAQSIANESNHTNTDRSFSVLLISRIETQRLNYVDLDKVHIIERVLDMQEGSLMDLSDVRITSPTTDFSSPKREANDNCQSGKTDAMSDSKINDSNDNNSIPKIIFCWNCGIKLPFSNMRYCSQCGNRLSD